MGMVEHENTLQGHAEDDSTLLQEVMKTVQDKSRRLSVGCGADNDINDDKSALPPQPALSGVEDQERSAEPPGAPTGHIPQQLEDVGLPSLSIHRQTSTRTAQEIIDWVNQQPPTSELSPQNAADSIEQGKAQELDDRGPDGISESNNTVEVKSINDIRTRTPPSGRTSPRKSHHSRSATDPKSRVLRESRQDQFAPPSRQGTFESQHRGIYGFQMSSTTSIADQFAMSRRDSAGTVGTAGSAAASEVTSSKRFSVSTIATTLASATSTDTLHAQFKRLRPDSRTNSFRSASIPSARSSAHVAANAPGQRNTRDFAIDSHEPQPPVPAFPRHVLLEEDTVQPSVPDPPSGVLEAGTVAQMRRVTHGNRAPGADIQGNQASSFLETGADFLSVINEHLSDAGSMLVASPRPSLEHRSDPRDCLTDAPSPSSYQSPERRSVFSRDTSPLESSATSLGDILSRDPPSHASSDGEDTMSDVTDHTDLSLIEAFEATSFDPALLSVLMSLKEEVVDRIKRRFLTAMLQTRGPQEGTTGAAATVTHTSGITASNTGQGTSFGNLPSRKRAFDGGDADEEGRGNDDGDRKQRRITTSEALEERLRKFACPFFKRYPGSDILSKSCCGPGWVSVHRVKEHIYRRHQQPPFRCSRCFDSFADEAQLTQHVKARVPCENKPEPPEEHTGYISKTQELALRKKKKGLPEEERWIDVFKILFPTVPEDQIPPPYHESPIQQQPTSAANVEEFQAFLLRQLPSRITSGVNDHLRLHLVDHWIEEGIMAEMIRSTMREVMEEFRPILASLTMEGTGVASPQTLEPPQADQVPHAPRHHPSPQPLQHNAHTTPVQARPVGGGQPQHHASNWDSMSVFDTSTFDFGFIQDLMDASVHVPSYPLGDLPLWTVDDEDGGVITFTEELEGAPPLDDVHAS